MKKIILCLITSFIIVSGAFGQSNWRIVNEGIGMGISNVDYLNAETAWIFGSSVLKTTDRGNTWLLDTVAQQYEFSKIDFINDSIGWALGSKGLRTARRIYKTRDGGRTWFLQKTVAASASSANAIYAIDTSTVYILGTILAKTVDGGTSWVDITPPGDNVFRDGCFLNRDKGVLIGKDENGEPAIFRTFNGGEYWDTIPTEVYDICDIEFLNDSIGYFRAEGHIYKSTDTFNSWSAVTDESYSIQAYHFFDDDVAVSVMKDSSGMTRIIKSGDGGWTWENEGDRTLPSGWDYRFYFFDNVGYLISYSPIGGSLFLTTFNEGISWEVLSFSYPFRDVFFMNETEGFFAGGLEWTHFSFGNLIRTDDAFKTFDFILGNGGGALGGPSYKFRYCHFISDSVGFYSDGTLYETSNGGENWIRDTAFYEVDDICFINDSIGFVLAKNYWFGGEQRIYRTTDGGESWDSICSFENEYQLHSIFFNDENTGWGIGWSGEYCDDPETCVGGPTLIKYNAEQGWREIPLEASLPLDKIFFVDHDHSWISGGYSNLDGFYTLLLRSEDGGESWGAVARVNYLISDFYFETIDHGWAVGQDINERGVILETFNSGRTWKAVVDGLSAPLNALHIKDGHGWAVGQNGLVLKTIYSSSSAVDRFMVVGDLHHSSPSSDLSHSMLYELTHAAIKEKVEFVFFTGDLGMRTFGTPEEEDSVLKDWRFVLDTLYQNDIRVYACRGNVDAGSPETWDSLFSGIYSFPLNGPETEKNLTYAIEYDNLLFVSLDLYTEAHQINQHWLDSILSTTTREHLFVAGHESAFKVSMSNVMNIYPEERNLFWESLTDAGAKAYFCGHDHFYDHAVIDDGNGNPLNDVHQVIVGTGGGSIIGDSEYNGENGRWTPVRQFHEGEHGYVLVELKGEEVEMTWKHRTGPNLFEEGGDPYTFPTGTTDGPELQRGTEYLFNYPNPFRSGTMIRYQLSVFSDVELNVYDLTGRKVTTLVKEAQGDGFHEVEWNAEGLNPGIYLCELKTGKGRQVMKMILID